MFAVQTESGAEYLLVQITCRYGILAGMGHLQAWNICMHRIFAGAE